MRRGQSDGGDAGTVISAEFDMLAPRYETNRLSGWYKAHADMLIAHCAFPSHGTVLDVGCGTGYFLREVVRRNPGLEAVGVDVAAEMVKEATRRAESEGIRTLRFIEADWERDEDVLDRHECFDLIFCANAYHYFSDPATAVTRVFEHLRPGGRFYLLEREASSSLPTRVWGWLHRKVIRDHVLFYSDAELVRLLQGAGFAEVEVGRRVRRVFWHRKLFTSLVVIECKRGR